MATITSFTPEKIYQLKAWLGLNENPDGDTKLKLGEAAVMRNWAITRDANLRRRPGSFTVSAPSLSSPVNGMWYGRVGGKEKWLAASGGVLWLIWEEGSEDLLNTRIGNLDTTQEVGFIPFSNALYILDGTEYYKYDGNTLAPVNGYVPLVAIAVPPDGGGELLEKVNRLNGKRRMWLSPDAKGNTFKFPEQNLKSVDYVKDLKTDEVLPAAKYSANLAEGTITFTESLTSAVNAYEVGWSVDKTFRSQVTAMRFGELYDGAQDTRVFLYGDGTNRTIYSGIDYDGNPSAEYFPDLNDVSVGSANEAITSLIRQYSTLMCFKEDSAWSITSGGLLTLADGSKIPAFHSTPTNKIIGNAALGQARLVLNAPYTLHGNDLFEWRNTSSYASNLSKDERQAKRISDKIYQTLSEFKLSDCYCFDDNFSQEYYICYNNRCLVNNYAADAWYLYTGWNVSCMVNVRGELFFGTPDGKIKHVSYDYLSDDGQPIDAYWESGSMSFGQDYMRKYSALTWIGIKPDSNGEVYVAVQTDRKSSNPEKIVVSSLASFNHANFAKWSFATNRKPQMHKLKLKAKKFEFYKLIFQSNSDNTQATILAADIKVRATGYAK